MEDFHYLLLCPRCDQLCKKRRLSLHEEARCPSCNYPLYRSWDRLSYHILTLSSVLLTLFVIANFFPLVSIDISASQSSLKLLEAIMQLFDEGYIFISFFSLLVLFLFPLLIVLSLFTYSFLSIIKKFFSLSKMALILYGYLRAWSMLDIFFIAILVAMVKIYDYAHIELGIAFWALAFFVLIEVYLVHVVRPLMLWEEWQERYGLSEVSLV